MVGFLAAVDRFPTMVDGFPTMVDGFQTMCKGRVQLKNMLVFTTKARPHPHYHYQSNSLKGLQGFSTFNNFFAVWVVGIPTTKDLTCN